ncbi:MAG: L,D-transpeptidase family protein [Longimicrobiales bacterium]
MCSGLRSVVAVLSSVLLLHAAATVAHARQGAAQRDIVNASRRAASLRAGDFTTTQLQHPRVMEARLQMRFGIKRLFRERGIPYPAEQIFLRVFKRERMLELWVRPPSADQFVLLKQYMICALQGDLGPKRGQGDGQTPEGFYEIDHFNPSSVYHLSLHVNYPNSSDRVLGRADGLGGDIMIHGGCESIGCIAVTNEAIKELYWIAVEARAAGQARIPVHIFPARLTNDELGLLGRTFGKRPNLITFWTSLKPGFDYFERTHQIPAIRVDAQGRYSLLN